MAEIEFAGIKFKGGRMVAVAMGLSTLVGGLYGGFEVYKDYMDMKDKLANLDVEAIAARNAVLETKLEEALSYAKDIKNDLRSDVIAVEKALGDVEGRIRSVESENRTTIQDAKKWFDERTANIDEKLTSMEERLGKRIQRALDNPLLKDMKQ